MGFGANRKGRRKCGKNGLSANKILHAWKPLQLALQRRPKNSQPYRHSNAQNPINITYAMYTNLAEHLCVQAQASRSTRLKKRSKRTSNALWRDFRMLFKRQSVA
jgi:hypothetical protein